MTPADRPDDQPMDEAEVERMLAELDALGTTEEQHPGTRPADTRPADHPATAEDAPAESRPADAPARIALVLTPVASAPALAGLCAVSGIDVGVVPTSGGAMAVLQMPARPASEDGEWDIGELVGAVGGGPAVPTEADGLARTLSRLSRAGVVLLTAELATDVGIETGLSGQVTAHRYANGEDAGEVAPGLVIAAADQVVEDLILGRSAAADVRGYQRSGELPRWKAARMLGKGLRRRKP
ncbi:hypothetical protein PU560_15530 [Georgenia sp. 10Sc9-8]|uniref:Uncharacterized protein n=1 Tax=Georgenia halotolerans TaxID=3028317 RepID=A0ABT5U412_9MICO|nr:hypothetical protein [Georgenia halotolerans]